MFHLDEGRKQLANVVGQVGMPIDKFLQARSFATTPALGELLGQLIEQCDVSRVLASHVTVPPVHPAGQTGRP